MKKKLESIIKNNRYIHFQMFSTEKKYDGIISFEKRDIYGHTPFIQVNKETSMQELVRIEMFVTELFEKLKVNQKQERQINYT
ncbi:hypothetical protein [Streptococcus urinalis]|uniref:hypothetical protein n=1 Tax=Streptococcus urinalis TaxID=149016 RepID=UPI00055E5C1E|nr:hypothetical protein [Streptococcus urinalis]